MLRWSWLSCGVKYPILPNSAVTAPMRVAIPPMIAAIFVKIPSVVVQKDCFLLLLLTADSTSLTEQITLITFLQYLEQCWNNGLLYQVLRICV